ncbi:ROK family transcriptional regulator [Ammoniphilus sp. YIM 78166]|uniref:ROK family transcriptional regulator n=1 Tax=Ammoniphilus sp. YIM 78166 TaxID=1644106 RepID=UPI0010703403|nr:ROK family transcriptional regulator [Ammoniphilus sp. YIM 78166]
MASGMVGSFQLMKSLNKSLILNVIRLDGPISRAEIAKKTNLTPPTVTNLVAELLASNLVIESDLGTSSVGRKPIMLRIHASAFQVIGIDVGASHLKLVSTNLNAEIQETLLVKMPNPITAPSFLELLIHSVDTLLEKSQLQKDTILGIGIGMHGLVNPKQGVADYAPNLALRHIPIREKLETAFNLPVEIENDVRAMALGESWFGNGQGIENFICVNVGMGIGAGIILDHKLFTGASFTAGEIGHTTIEIEGPKCSCGNHGCLQALAAGPAIASRVQEEIRLGRESLIAELVHGDVEEITGETVHQAALQGDPLAIEALKNTGRYLGIGVANLINILNPSRIILGGGVSKAGEFILGPMKETVEKRALNSASICEVKLGDFGTAIGAATLVLQKLFMPEYSNGDTRGTERVGLQ